MGIASDNNYITGWACAVGANYAWSVRRRRNHQAGQGYAMGALGRRCDVWRWKHTVASTFNSRGYSEDVAVIVVARGGYVTAE